MFDLGWSEILVIGVVALVVVGPKDLPNLLRMAGRAVRQARGVARNFQGAMDQMLRESELADLKREFNRDLGADDVATPRIQPPQPTPPQAAPPPEEEDEPEPEPEVTAEAEAERPPPSATPAEGPR